MSRDTHRPQTQSRMFNHDHYYYNCYRHKGYKKLDTGYTTLCKTLPKTRAVQETYTFNDSASSSAPCKYNMVISKTLPNHEQDIHTFHFLLRSGADYQLTVQPPSKLPPSEFADPVQSANPQVFRLVGPRLGGRSTRRSESGLS